MLVGPPSAGDLPRKNIVPPPTAATPFIPNFISPVGVAEPFRYQNLHACPAWGYFSVKKSNQKSLGEDPETPRVGTPRIIGAPARSQDLVGKGGCTAAGRAARSKAQGQPDLSEGCVRRDDAYKVFILIRSLLNPNKMRRRHLESVSAAPYGRCFCIVRIPPQLKR